MRYTEARLAPIARLLLVEIDEGTVDFVPNYDGSTEEPRLLPALAKQLETLSAINLKRTWIDNAAAGAWTDARWAEPNRFLHQATQVKNVWVPYGV